MGRLSSILVVGGVLVALVLAGCGGGTGGGGNGNDPPPPPPGQIVIWGRVISSLDSTGVKDVRISVGTGGTPDEVTDLTDADGDFSIVLPSRALMLLDLYATIPHDFRVSTTLAGENHPDSLPVAYNNPITQQTETAEQINGVASFEVHADILTSTTSRELGTIIVTYYDPENPPPPPF